MFQAGMAVSVNGVPGVVVAMSGTHVAVRLAGERRVDEWHVSQVSVDPT